MDFFAFFRIAGGTQFFSVDTLCMGFLCLCVVLSRIYKANFVYLARFCYIRQIKLSLQD